MRRYYITDRRQCSDLLACIERAAKNGVEYIQIREKDLTTRELVTLTREAVHLVRSWPTRILVNGRVDVALAAGAHGVHLPSDAIAPETWRKVVPPSFLIAMSCHSENEILSAAGADLVVYGPVFASPGKGTPIGLARLREAVKRSSLPVFALGGVDESNAQACLDAGAAGIAAIRMFQS